MRNSMLDDLRDGTVAARPRLIAETRAWKSIDGEGKFDTKAKSGCIYLLSMFAG